MLSTPPPLPLTHFVLLRGHSSKPCFAALSPASFSPVRLEALGAGYFLQFLHSMQALPYGRGYM